MLIRLLRIGFGLFVVAGLAQSMGVPVYEMFFLKDFDERIEANFDDSTYEYEAYDPDDLDGDGYDDDDSGYEYEDSYDNYDDY